MMLLFNPHPSRLLLLPFLLLSPSLSLAQTTSTAALTSLTSGPLSYASASLSTNPSCRTLCQALITSARTCTEDECACGDGVVNGAESCLDCLIGDVGTSNGQTIRTGFNAYANLCVSEGYLDQVPTLIPSPAGTSTTTSLAAAATSTAGYAAFTNWLTLVGGSCPTDCAPVTNDYQACTATDSCICVQSTIDDGETCQTCVLSNIDGTFTTAQLTNARTLWARVQQSCSLLATTTVLPSSASTSSTSTSTTGRRSSTTSTGIRTTNTAIPQQSYYTRETTTTATTTSGVRADATPGTVGPAGASSGATRKSGMSDGVTMLCALAGGVVMLVGGGIL